MTRDVCRCCMCVENEMDRTDVLGNVCNGLWTWLGKRDNGVSQENLRVAVARYMTCYTAPLPPCHMLLQPCMYVKHHAPSHSYVTFNLLISTRTSQALQSRKLCFVGCSNTNLTSVFRHAMTAVIFRSIVLSFLLMLRLFGAGLRRVPNSSLCILFNCYVS